MKSRDLPVQLADLRNELVTALNRAHQLADALTDEAWGARPGPDRWSVAECLAHLNISSAAFLLRIEDAMAKGRRDAIVGDGPFGSGLVGWLFARILEPPSRVRAKTPAAFVPPGVVPKTVVLRDFDRLQAELVTVLEKGVGLDFGRLRIVSPFAKLLRHNLYSTYRIISAHQRRHLWQAERALSGG